MIELTGLRFWLWHTLALAAVSVAHAQPSAEPDAIYAYTDDRGALVHVQRLSDVPMHLRRAARRVDAAPAAASGSNQLLEWWSGERDVEDEPAVYRYRGARGQTVYTNLLSDIPVDQRGQARVDLQNVPLNSELGTAMNQKLMERFEALKSGKACSDARSEAARPFWERAWREQPMAVTCGGVLLGWLLLVPFMHRRGWGGPWARVLLTALPILGLMGLAGSVLSRANASMASLLPRAQRCDPSAFQAADGLPQRFKLVSTMEREQKALAQIERESEH
jgi:hypothetical protein